MDRPCLRSFNHVVTTAQRLSLRAAVVLPLLLAAGTSSATTFTVTTTADSGLGSLRQAILDANADTTDCSSSTPHTVAFNIAGAGPHVIAPTSALPTIVSSVVIDGYTQPGASANTLAEDTNAVMTIVLNGAGAGASSGLAFGTQGGRPCTPAFSTVRGLVIRNFAVAGISAANVSVVRIRGNYIGTDHTGATAAANGIGVELGTNTFGWIIGDQDFGSGGPSSPTPAFRNVISGNAGPGVRTVSGNVAQPSQTHSIRGNYIGLTASGTAPLGNGTGINVAPGSTNISMEDNFIGGSTLHGIHMEGGATHLVRENWIGLTTLTGPAGNLGDGVRASGDARGVVIGSSFAVPHIANNGQAGVYIEGDANVLVRAMAMASNGGLGIDIAPVGVNANDAQDADTGPNDLQNYPILTAAVSDGIGGTISGTLNSTPNTQVSLEFYVSTSCDPSGFGEGETVLRSGGGGGIPTIINVTTDAGGNAAFSQAVPVLPPGLQLTAVATRFGSAPGNPLIASEFSQCRLITGPANAGSIQLGAATYSVGEGAGSATVTVTRTGGTTGAVSVQLATSNGSASAPGDYAASTTTVNFADGDGAAKTVAIPIVNDAAVEGNETVNLALSNAAGGATLGTPANAVLTILDDDAAPPTPTLSINGVSNAEGNGGTTPFLFIVTLSAASAQTVTVSFATADGTATAGSDYASVSGTLTFAPGTTAQPIAVNVIGDTVAEASETFLVTLSNSTNATLALAQGTGTILNDDNVIAPTVQPIPTVGEWTLVALASLLAALGVFALRRRGASGA